MGDDKVLWLAVSIASSINVMKHQCDDCSSREMAFSRSRPVAFVSVIERFATVYRTSLSGVVCLRNSRG